MAPLILASASPRRLELLKSLGISFEVCPADVDEHINGAINKPPPTRIQTIISQFVNHVNRKGKMTGSGAGEGADPVGTASEEIEIPHATEKKEKRRDEKGRQNRMAHTVICATAAHITD